MYRSGTNVEIATRHLAAVLKDLHMDPLLIKMFAQQSSAELRYIEWVNHRSSETDKHFRCVCMSRFENI